MKHLLRRFIVAPLGVGGVSLFYFLRYPRLPGIGPLDADNEMFKHSRDEHLARLPTTILLRRLFVHAFCTHPRFVDFGIWIMKTQRGSVPVLDSIIRHTFFVQFCGGETREEAVDLGRKLNAEGIVPLLGYSKESSDSPIDIQNTENEIIRCIEEMRTLQKPAFIAIKLSGLSPYDGLRILEQDIHNLVSSTPAVGTVRFFSQARQLVARHPDLFNRLRRISDAAERCDVNLVVDAEIRFQGTVDAMPTSAVLCFLLNSNKFHIWNTHQMIFQDSVERLREWSGNNSIKLVRGAYLHREPAEKVVRAKHEADENYDNAARELITKRYNSVILATHNHHSVVKAFRLLQQGQVAVGSQPRNICFGQLYGMGDDITYGLVRGSNNISLPQSVNISIIKYVPYGGLRDVMPYLIRRAEENRGILRGSMLEREALYDEVKRRIVERIGLGLSQD